MTFGGIDIGYEKKGSFHHREYLASKKEYHRNRAVHHYQVALAHFQTIVNRERIPDNALTAPLERRD